MALQYDAPTSVADFNEQLDSRNGISDSTKSVINDLLTSLQSPDGTVAVGFLGTDGQLQAPAGQTVQVVAAEIDGAAGTNTNLVLPEAAAGAKVVIINSDTNVTMEVSQPVVAEARAFAVAADAPAADAPVTPDLVIVGGNGNDNLTYTGSGNVVLDGGDGNDVLITGAGNDVISGGEGNDHIESGAGNDTINTGHGQDTILAGAGRDLINVDGASTDFDVRVTGSFLHLDGTGGNAVTIQGGEFVTFTDNHTLAIVENDSEAAALRLFDGLLGRDADNGGAEYFTSQVQAGASLSSIADQFLGSAEYKGAIASDFVNEAFDQLLGRSAEDTAVAYWQDQLAQGKSQADVAALISTSAEAQANGQSNVDFISALYETALGRGASTDDNSYWVGQLIGGSSRADVVGQIFGSAEASHHANSDFVDALYENALGRQAGDTDPGKAQWVAALDQGTSQADVAIGIVGSPEGVDHNSNVVVVHGAV